MTAVLVRDDIVLNVDSAGELARMLADGWRELTPAEIAAAGMVGYEHLVSPDNTAVREDGTITFTPPPLEDAKAAKLAEANARCDAILRGLVAKYPEMEISTFAKQEAEARALAENPDADAPFLTALAANRGIELAELAARVLAHAEAFGQASGAVIGQRQAFEDALDAAETLADVDAINVACLLPWEA